MCLFEWVRGLHLQYDPVGSAYNVCRDIKAASRYIIIVTSISGRFCRWPKDEIRLNRTEINDHVSLGRQRMNSLETAAVRMVLTVLDSQAGQVTLTTKKIS